ncbi:MAG: hypothetical protein AMXMBFR58_33650 [Phycisphaerae bacterium]|nr:hypothetical protein [Phycisphaerales bacterium]MCK6475582.1 chemotaxis protein CheW [Phycisphaerales bacterium]
MLSVIWQSAELCFATDARLVVEVLPPLAFRPVPAAPGWVRGLFSHRGRLIPLVDAARLLDQPVVPDRMANRVLVVRCSPGPDHVPWTAGLWVHSILEIDRIDFDQPGSHPGLATGAGRFLGAIAQTRWGQVQLVEPRELFTPEQAAVLADRLKEAAA